MLFFLYECSDLYRLTLEFSSSGLCSSSVIAHLVDFLVYSSIILNARAHIPLVMFTHVFIKAHTLMEIVSILVLMYASAHSYLS